MGVKPVEYKRDSSTQGFAVAGDEKVITKQNANTIKKDVDQGNTQDLDNAQSRCLENYVDYDNIEYSEEENKNVGRNQIDTSKAKGINGLNATGTMVGSAGSTVAGGLNIASGFEYGRSAFQSGTTQSSISITFGKDTMTKTTTNGTGMLEGGNKTETTVQTDGGQPSNPKEAGDKSDKLSKTIWTALAAGAIATAGGALALASAEGFDPQYKDRTSQRDSADGVNQIIQQYYDELTNNMDSMTADSVAYAEAAEKKFGESVALIDVIGEIDAQIIEYRAQGNEAKVAELMKQKEQYKKDAEVLNTDDPDGMGALKENIELYASRNAEAQGVSESGDTVSNFLKDGNTLSFLGYVQGALMTVGALLMLKGSINAVKSAMKVPFFLKGLAAVIAITACALMVAGNVLTALAAKNMLNKAANENKCGSAGEQMGKCVEQLNQNIEAQAGFTEETAAGYTAIDEAGAEELAKTQEGVNEANKGLAGAVGGNKGNGENPTTTPPVTNEPTTPPVGDKPEDNTNPNGGDGVTA